jgi:hypothetical protein
MNREFWPSEFFNHAARAIEILIADEALLLATEFLFFFFIASNLPSAAPFGNALAPNHLLFHFI